MLAEALHGGFGQVQPHGCVSFFDSADASTTSKLARSTVARLLKRHGLQRLALLQPKPPIQRYEWPSPGDMLHIDIKRLPRIERPCHRIHGDRTTRVTGAGYEHVHLRVHARAAVASRSSTHTSAALSSTGAMARGLGSSARTNKLSLFSNLGRNVQIPNFRAS